MEKERRKASPDKTREVKKRERGEIERKDKDREVNKRERVVDARRHKEPDR